MKLLEHLYLIASGDVGLSLTSYLDCNVYLIDTGGGAILIDAGAGHQPEQMDAVLQSHGFDYADIKLLLLTHYHADHSCGAARVARKSGCAVYAPELEAPAIAAGDTVQLGLAPAMAAGYVYPAGYRYEACPGVLPLKDGQTVSLGNVSVTARAVPGHSLQTMAFTASVDGRDCLFSGDALFPGGSILLQNLPDVSIYPYGQALKKLAALSVDVFLPGHREPSLARGKRHLDKANAVFANLLPAPQL